jgi:hypothetical protein
VLTAATKLKLTEEVLTEVAGGSASDGSADQQAIGTDNQGLPESAMLQREFGVRLTFFPSRCHS